jgi:hypothetical protein
VLRPRSASATREKRNVKSTSAFASKQVKECGGKLSSAPIEGLDTVSLRTGLGLSCTCTRMARSLSPLSSVSSVCMASRSRVAPHTTRTGTVLGAGLCGGGSTSMAATSHSLTEIPSTRRRERHGEGWERKSRWSECGREGETSPEKVRRQSSSTPRLMQNSSGPA